MRKDALPFVVIALLSMSWLGTIPGRSGAG